MRPSTRALSLVATGEQILRQELRAPEPGAVVARRNWGAELQNFVLHTLFLHISCNKAQKFIWASVFRFSLVKVPLLFPS